MRDVEFCTNELLVGQSFAEHAKWHPFHLVQRVSFPVIMPSCELIYVSLQLPRRHPSREQLLTIPWATDTLSSSD